MLLPSKASWLVWDASKADNLDPVYPGIKVQHVRLSADGPVDELAGGVSVLVLQQCPPPPHTLRRVGISGLDSLREIV